MGSARDSNKIYAGLVGPYCVCFISSTQICRDLRFEIGKSEVGIRILFKAIITNGCLELKNKVEYVLYIFTV